MPRPPVLPVVNWSEIFESGSSYSDWLQKAEHESHAYQIDTRRRELELQPVIEAALKVLDRAVYCVAIAEDWCGDVVRHVPVISKFEEVSSNFSVRYISREQHPGVFVRFLTNGGEAIPKFILLNDSFVECGNWGPMPARCCETIARGKAAGDVPRAREKVNILYEADPDMLAVQEEMFKLICLAASRRA